MGWRDTVAPFGGPWIFDKRNSPYDNAKIAAISGLGYFVLTNPQGVLRATLRIAAATLAEQVGTYRKVVNIVGEELLAKDAIVQHAKGKFPVAGTLWSVSPWIPFTLFGGTIIQAWEQVGCSLTGETIYGCEGDATNLAWTQ
jgi:hypothetical protein